MEILSLEADKRNITGKKVRFLRRNGQTPANLYGPKTESIAIQTDTKKLEQVLTKAGGTDLISLTIGKDKAVKVLVRGVQREPLTNELLHVDFYKVDLTKKIEADVPIHFHGEAPALKLGNVSVIHLLDELRIEALPDHIPHRIEVDLSMLHEIDQAITVKDIKLPSDITILNDPEQVIAKAIEAKAEVVEEAPAVEEEAEKPEAPEGPEEKENEEE